MSEWTGWEGGRVDRMRRRASGQDDKVDKWTGWEGGRVDTMRRWASEQDGKAGEWTGFEGGRVGPPASGSAGGRHRRVRVDGTDAINKYPTDSEHGHLD